MSHREHEGVRKALIMHHEHKTTQTNLEKIFCFGTKQNSPGESRWKHPQHAREFVRYLSDYIEPSFHFLSPPY